MEPIYAPDELSDHLSDTERHVLINTDQAHIRHIAEEMANQIKTWDFSSGILTPQDSTRYLAVVVPLDMTVAQGEYNRAFGPHYLAFGTSTNMGGAEATIYATPAHSSRDALICDLAGGDNPHTRAVAWCWHSYLLEAMTALPAGLPWIAS